MVDKYRVVNILLIWLKSRRHTIGVEGPRYMCSDIKSNNLANANYILNNTTYLAHKIFLLQ